MKKLLYIECKSSGGHRGDAWIGLATLSRSGRTVYFNGRGLKRQSGMTSGNHYCIETLAEYWVSGPKKNGEDRHWAGGGTVRVEAAALDAYLEFRGQPGLSPRTHVVDHDVKPTDIERLTELQNEPDEAEA